MTYGPFHTLTVNCESSATEKHSLQRETPKEEGRPTEAPEHPLKRLRAAYESFTKSQKDEPLPSSFNQIRRTSLLSSVDIESRERSVISVTRNSSDHRLSIADRVHRVFPDMFHPLDGTVAAMKKASQSPSTPDAKRLKMEPSTFGSDDHVFDRLDEPHFKEDHAFDPKIDLLFEPEIDMVFEDLENVIFPASDFEAAIDHAEELPPRSFLQPRSWAFASRSRYCHFLFGPDVDQSELNTDVRNSILR